MSGCEGEGQYIFSTEEEMRQFAAEFGKQSTAGDVVLLDGPLGVGKTTFVRGVMAGLGYTGKVKSPTFNLIQTFDTTPPVMHADLYRVKSYEGIGLEDYLETHVCLIEWPDRAAGLVDPERCWRLNFEFVEGGRRLTITVPNP